jgi:hypothetical protein
MNVVRTITILLLSLALAAPSLAAAPATARDKGAGLGQEQVRLDANTEQIIRGALKYLASRQNGNGSWATGSGEQQEVAMTGYVLVTFLAAGQLPDEGEYGKNVTAGMNYLLNMVRPDGTMGRHGHYMYGHGVASIALAELYGQTRDPRIRPKLEQVIKLIIQSQNREGGWRYNPGASDADISVTVLQVVALRAAKNSGLEVPQATIDRAVGYVRSCFHERSGGFTYQPRGGDPGFARTAAAVYSLQVCGQYDDPRVQPGIKYLHKSRDDRQWFTYGHFYAAPALYMVGGEDWKTWYTAMSKMLLEKVKRQGDMVWWDPHWDGGRGVGPVYCTAVYTMILAMPYHYLPLYQR